METRLMLHDLPPFLCERAQEEQRSQHDPETRQTQRHKPGAADAVDGVCFGAVFGYDVCFDCAGDPQADGDGVVDHCVDERGREALVFFGHGVGEDYCCGWEGHVHAEGWDEGQYTMMLR